MSKMNRLTLATLALAGLGAVASGNAVAGSMTVDTKGGVELFDLDTDAYWFKLGGRIHADTVIFEGDDPERSAYPSGSALRRVRVTLKGGVGHNWVYKLDVDYKDRATKVVTGSGTGARVGFSTGADVEIGEAFLAYNGCRNIWLAVGQVSVPYSLEGWASSNETTFMEQSLPTDAFGFGNGIGVYAEWHNDMFTLAGAVVHPRRGQVETGDVLSTWPTTTAGNANQAGAGPFGSDPGSARVTAGGRVTFSPVHDGYTSYHAGFSYRHQELHDNANNFNIGTALELRSRQSPVFFTNIPPNSAKSNTVLGFEAAGQWGPLILSGEYTHSHVDREASYPLLDDPRNPAGEMDLEGYYVAASYVLTGEVREYDFVSGTFGSVKPKSRKGAWEIAARHSHLKLVDNEAFRQLPVPLNYGTAGGNLFNPNFGNPGNGFQNLPGGNPNDFTGKISSTTVGLNWYANENVRLMANYVRLSLENSGDINALGFRAQVKW